jgi:hypothetical protein
MSPHVFSWFALLCCVVGLSSTPVQNSTQELWNLLHFIDPKSFNEPEAFQASYGDVNNSAQMEQLHQILKPYLLRRLKEDVAKNVRCAVVASAAVCGVCSCSFAGAFDWCVGGCVHRLV